MEKIKTSKRGKFLKNPNFKNVNSVNFTHKHSGYVCTQIALKLTLFLKEMQTKS